MTQEVEMSVVGTKRPSRRVRDLVAIGGIVDIDWHWRELRL
jgi:hypothetical protein